MASQHPPGESKTINISRKKMCKWVHSNLLENPKQSIFQHFFLQMASQQPPGESKAINHGFAAASWRIRHHQYFNKKKLQMNSQQPPEESEAISHGFAATSWRIKNKQYFNKKFENGFTAASWRIQSHQSWLRNSLLENPKPQIFQ